MRIPSKASMAMAILCCGLGPNLSGEDFKLGGQVGVNVPTGHLKSLVDGKAGVSASVFALVDLRDGQALRPRLTYHRWEGSQPARLQLTPLPTGLADFTGDQTTRVTSWTLGADYLRYLQGTPDEGLYLLAGLGLAANRRATEIRVNTASLEGSANASRSSTHLELNLGFGYQFSRAFGLEAGYRWTTLTGRDIPLALTTKGGTGSPVYNVTAPQQGGSLGSWTLAATVHF